MKKKRSALEHLVTPGMKAAGDALAARKGKPDAAGRSRRAAAEHVPLDAREPRGAALVERVALSEWHAHRERAGAAVTG